MSNSEPISEDGKDSFVSILMSIFWLLAVMSSLFAVFTFLFYGYRMFMIGFYLGNFAGFTICLLFLLLIYNNFRTVFDIYILFKKRV